MKTSAFYSTNASDPDVHHDQTACSAGQRIPEYNKALGTNGYRKCKICADLG